MGGVKRKRLAKNLNQNAKNKKVDFLPPKIEVNNVSDGPPPSMRQRQNIVVLDTEKFGTVPSCSHGPCLLFCDGSNRKWFSCSVFRSSKDCPYVVGVNADDVVQKYEDCPPRTATLPFEEYGKISKAFNVLSKKKTLKCFCVECFNYVSMPHKHPVDGPFDELIPPTKLIPAIENTKGEAQFWFSGDTLDIVKNALVKEEIDSVLCVGTPTVFEHLGDSFKRFLLDFDDRLSLFYKNSEFARYSMLTNHFFLEKSKEELQKFFVSAEKLAIICDPPFGVFIAALMKSLFKLRDMFVSTGDKKASDCKFVVFLPIFVAKHVLRMDPAFSIVDFKVTYKNHRDFSSDEKSIVRIVTDFTNKHFELPAELGYKFCTLCDRFVTKTNSHCKLCKSCTSKDGSPFVHCKVCKKCVKGTYIHCDSCKFCHLRNRCPKSKDF